MGCVVPQQRRSPEPRIFHEVHQLHLHLQGRPTVVGNAAHIFPGKPGLGKCSFTTKRDCGRTQVATHCSFIFAQAVGAVEARMSIRESSRIATPSSDI